MGKNLRDKLVESLQAVSPIGIIILLLHFTIAPMPGGTLALMLVGMGMLIVGLTLFSMGTDLAMMPMGEHVGSALFASRNLPLLVGVLFVFGFIVTAAEPDLTVLATQVVSMPNPVLIATISAGVGAFLVLAAFRILLRWKLSHLLLVLYGIAFVLAFFSREYLAVAFDASAVTTGPVTVPFLLAIGAGFSAISSSKSSEEDNFGICAICSVGPILAVLILGLFFGKNQAAMENQAHTAESPGDIARLFATGLGHTFLEVLLVVVPILAIFLLFQLVKLKLSRSELMHIFIGLGYLLVGLTIFLAGVNYGFMPAATALGTAMGALPYNWILIPLCLIIGAGVVVAEPAVHVLTRQVEEITSGAISRSMMLFGMALGVGLAMSLAMVRILVGIPFAWIIIPGFSLALLLSFFVPDMFVGIGFDSGGVAAGAMSAAFVLPFAVGVSQAVGGQPMQDAFGVVGMIAMMPPITIQIMGILYGIQLRRSGRLDALVTEENAQAAEAESEIEMYLRRPF